MALQKTPFPSPNSPPPSFRGLCRMHPSQPLSTIYPGLTIPKIDYLSQFLISLALIPRITTFTKAPRPLNTSVPYLLIVFASDALTSHASLKSSCCCSCRVSYFCISRFTQSLPQNCFYSIHFCAFIFLFLSLGKEGDAVMLVDSFPLAQLTDTLFFILLW